MTDPKSKSEMRRLAVQSGVCPVCCVKFSEVDKLRTKLERAEKALRNSCWCHMEVDDLGIPYVSKMCDACEALEASRVE